MSLLYLTRDVKIYGIVKNKRIGKKESYSKSKTYTLKIEVPMVVEKRYIDKNGEVRSHKCHMCFDVKGMKHNFKTLLIEGELSRGRGRNLPRERKESLLDYYAILDYYVKFYIYDLLGLETVPLKETITLSYEEHFEKNKNETVEK